MSNDEKEVKAQGSTVKTANKPLVPQVERPEQKKPVSTLWEVYGITSRGTLLMREPRKTLRQLLSPADEGGR